MKLVICLLLALLHAAVPAGSHAAEAADDTTTLTSTAAAASREEACTRAQALASEDGQVAGACACEVRGKMNICRVQSTGAAPTKSLVDKAKEEIRERLRCQPEVEDCRPKRNAGSGVRG